MAGIVTHKKGRTFTYVFKVSFCSISTLLYAAPVPRYIPVTPLEVFGSQVVTPELDLNMTQGALSRYIKNRDQLTSITKNDITRSDFVPLYCEYLYPELLLPESLLHDIEVNNSLYQKKYTELLAEFRKRGQKAPVKAERYEIIEGDFYRQQEQRQEKITKNKNKLLGAYNHLIQEKSDLLARWGYTNLLTLNSTQQDTKDETQNACSQKKKRAQQKNNSIQKKSLDALILAADNKNKLATFCLAYAYGTGSFGCIQDSNTAQSYYNLLPDMPEALHNEALLIDSGDQELVNKKIDLLTRASNRGLARAYYNLAVLYELNNNTLYPEIYYKNAMDKGDLYGLLRVIQNLHSGVHIEEAYKLCCQINDAQKTADIWCEQAHIERDYAQFNNLDISSDNQEKEPCQFIKKAQQSYKNAINAYSPEAQFSLQEAHYHLGGLYFNEQDSDSKKEALVWLKLPAHSPAFKKTLDAQYKQAFIYFYLENHVEADAILSTMISRNAVNDTNYAIIAQAFFLRAAIILVQTHKKASDKKVKTATIEEGLLEAERLYNKSLEIDFNDTVVQDLAKLEYKLARFYEELHNQSNRKTNYNKKAITYLEKACDHGSVMAQEYLAAYYFNFGQAVSSPEIKKGAYIQAYELFKKLESKTPTSNYFLALIEQHNFAPDKPIEDTSIETDGPVETGFDLALYYYNKMLEMIGAPPYETPVYDQLYYNAHLNKGVIFLKKDVIQEAQDEFIIALESSVEETVNSARCNLGGIYRNQKQFEKARKLYQDAADSGMPRALTCLGILALAEKDEILDQDTHEDIHKVFIDKAIYYFEKAMKKQDPEAYFYRAKMLEKDDSYESIAHAMMYYQKAASMGHTGSCERLKVPFKLPTGGNEILLT